MIWGGGPEEIEKKKISETLLREKNPFSIFSPPPQIINGRPLMENFNPFESVASIFFDRHFSAMY